MRTGWILGAVAALALPTAAQAVPSTADVIVVIDESGSMATEQGFIGGAITDIEAGLQAAGLSNNRYGLVGFGGFTGTSGRDVGAVNQGGGFLSATDFDTATADLNLSGGTEDGYAGIDFAFDNFTFRTAAAKNVILVTDEDRDNTDSSLTFNSILGEFTSEGALLNVVVNAELEDGSGNTALGIDDAGNAYVADGSGGFTTASGGTAVAGDGSTVGDYVDLGPQPAPRRRHYQYLVLQRLHRHQGAGDHHHADAGAGTGHPRPRRRGPRRHRLRLASPRRARLTAAPCGGPRGRRGAPRRPRRVPAP
jgi:hypothetical protein